MNNPTVACVMVTHNRPEMAARAVRCFREQTYENKRLVIFGSGYQCWHYPDFHPQGHAPMNEDDSIHWGSVGDSYTIGDLRNRAIKMDITGGGGPKLDKPADIFAHWDDDDLSHPNRLAEQVALLQSSGAECVGYNSMLFWDTRTAQYQEHGPSCHCSMCRDSEGKQHPVLWGPSPPVAWLYRALNPKHLLGTSLMYWRSAWERQPFDDVATGEDTKFLTKLGSKVLGVPSVEYGVPADCAPRMIASIHGSNSSGYQPEKDRASSRRVPEWDDYCSAIMKL